MYFTCSWVLGLSILFNNSEPEIANFKSSGLFGLDWIRKVTQMKS